jgi:CubicO group peptidase (beta-lactamase class C family)
MRLTVRSRSRFILGIGALAAALAVLSLVFLHEDLRRSWRDFRRSWSDRTVEWETGSPATAGLDSVKLEALCDTLAARSTWSFLIARGGRIVTEWYAEGAAEDERHCTASLAKGVVGGMALLVVLSDHRLRLDDLASTYIPAWRHDPVRSRITILQLATHTSGLEDAMEPGVNVTDMHGWKGDFWRRDPDPFSPVLEHAGVQFEPGSAFAYSCTGFAVLGYAVTASLRGAPQTSIRELLRERIMEPIGVPGATWRIGYGDECVLDGLVLQPIWGGGSYTTRAVARVGELLLRRGVWNGEELVDPTWVDAVTTYANTPLPDRADDPAYPAATPGWYTNFDGVWASVPRDAFAAAGAKHQLLLVVPSLDLVAVRFGQPLAEPDVQIGFWEAANLPAAQ